MEMSSMFILHSAMALWEILARSCVGSIQPELDDATRATRKSVIQCNRASAVRKGSVCRDLRARAREHVGAVHPQERLEMRRRVEVVQFRCCPTQSLQHRVLPCPEFETTRISDVSAARKREQQS